MPKRASETPEQGFRKPAAVLGLLLFAATATASDRCVNYVSEVSFRPREWALTSFNPRSRESLTVAKIDFVPYDVVWQTYFGAVTYKGLFGAAQNEKAFKLEWKLGAVPTRLTRTSHWVSPAVKFDQPVKLWDVDSPEVVCNFSRDNLCTVTAGLPASREIHVGEYDGCMLMHFMGPVTWVNTQTTETRVLYAVPEADSADGTGRPQISTADNFILISTEYNGADFIVADLNTGEIVLRAGTAEHRSMAAGWGNCPSK